jgi:hypothetical protein
MRTTAWVARVLSLFACAGAAVANGCFYTAPVDCEHDLVCDPSGSGTGGAGETPPGCVPSKNDTPVDNTCGIFVSSSQGKEGNAGTKSAPLKTLQQGIDQAKGKPVYACAEEFAGSVTLASGSAIYGGLDCTKGWAYVGATKKSALTGDADRPALTIAKESKRAELADFSIKAPTAMAAGGSSIAVLVDQVTARLDRCDLVAGDGAPGAEAVPIADDPSLDGVAGTGGAGACSAGASHKGGVGATKMCSSGGMSVAGSGGDGGLPAASSPPAGSGTDGSPADPGQPTVGKGGVGEGQSGAAACARGVDGAIGSPGVSGAGAIGVGSLTASGYSGAKGSEGAAGKPGQGGGGGGGAKGGLQVNCGTGNVDVAGASGGSGGTGGCGGASGGGGGPGGASIALVSLKATLTLTSVTLHAGKGGNGGKGGVGQNGGKQGTGGSFGSGGPLKASCSGGDGGQGGSGGPGGGGQGGPSLGVAYTGPAPAIEPDQITTGPAGLGGPGGTGNSTAESGKGADGVAVPMQLFP